MSPWGQGRPDSFASTLKVQRSAVGSDILSLGRLTSRWPTARLSPLLTRQSTARTGRRPPHPSGTAMAASSRTCSGPNALFERSHRDRLIAPTMKKVSPGLSPTATAIIHKAQAGRSSIAQCSPVAPAGRVARKQSTTRQPVSTLAPVAPGLFGTTGRGQGALVRDDAYGVWRARYHYLTPRSGMMGCGPR
jgi:hypothetical protein